jgi:hypothetical protein
VELLLRLAAFAIGVLVVGFTVSSAIRTFVLPRSAFDPVAWRGFAGWRVNYDTVLLALAALTMAPEAPWSSDHSFRQSRTRQKRS